MREYPRVPRTYELMTVLHPDLAEEQINENLGLVAGYVTAAGGTISETLRDSPWGRRRLAYPIRHGGRDLRDGYYTVFHFEMTPNSVIVMERDLKLNEQVIRYLITIYEPKPIDPREAEQAEIDAEDAAAAAYARAQAAAEAAPEAPAADSAAAESAPAATAETATEPASEAPATDVAESEAASADAIESVRADDQAEAAEAVEAGEETAAAEGSGA